MNQTPTFNNNQNIQANNITDIQMPEIPNQNNNSVMNNIPNEIQNTSDNQTQNVKMPTFNFEGQYQQKNSPPNILTPDFNIINSTPPMPEFNQINSAQMDNTIPTPEALNTPFEMPTMNSTPEVNTNIPQINNQNIQNDNMPTPNFNVIDSANTQPTLEVTNQSFEVPTMNNGLDIQNSNPIQMPEFNVPNNTLEENNTPTLEVLNQPFEMPTLNSNNIEPTLNNGMDMQNNMPNMQPNNEIPVFNSINNNENNVQGKDLTSAIAILKDVLPLLNHAGFNVTLDETDTNNEHLVTFKIQK